MNKRNMHEGDRDCPVLEKIDERQIIEQDTVLEPTPLLTIKYCIGCPFCPHAMEHNACYQPNLFANDIGLFEDGTETIDGMDYQRFLVLHPDKKDIVVLTNEKTVYYRKESKLNDSPLMRIDTLDELLSICGIRLKHA